MVFPYKEGLGKGVFEDVDLGLPLIYPLNRGEVGIPAVTGTPCPFEILFGNFQATGWFSMELSKF